MTVPVDHVLPVPEQLSFAEAAGIPEVAATVYSNLVLTCGMSMNPAENFKEDGEPAVVLVHGGTGGIGVHAIQLALAVGTRVFATVGTEEKAEYVRSLGAEPIIYTEHSFREVLLAETGGRGADYILDVVGGKYLDDNLHTLADGGHLCIIGLMGGAKAEVNLGYMLSRRLSVHATSLRTRSDRQKAEILRGVREHVLPLIESRQDWRGSGPYLRHGGGGCRPTNTSTPVSIAARLCCAWSRNRCAPRCHFRPVPF